jgi:soluble lytic murein transglycosylase-like protein
LSRTLGPTLRQAAIVAAFAGSMLAVPAPAVADELLYYVEDGQVVITNVASRPDVRTVPGFEEQVARALGSDLPVTPWDRTIDVVARRYGLSPDLIKAVAMVESGFDPRAVSPKGAIGLMQLMPATAAEYGVEDPYDPDQSLDGGARVLRDLLDAFDGDLTLALAGYNAGPGAVRRWRGVPAYRETRDYVRKVQGKLEPGARAKVAVDVLAGPDEIRMRRLPDGTVLLTN